MPLNTVTTGNTILAADINQLVNVLQRASGQTETGKYWAGGWSNAASDLISTYYISLNRTSVPVSVTLDTVDASTNVGAVNNDHLTANGVHIYFFSSVANTGCNGAGNVTLNF